MPPSFSVPCLFFALMTLTPKQPRGRYKVPCQQCVTGTVISKRNYIRVDRERGMSAGLIFDVEGTLVDSVPQNLRSLQDASDCHGYRVPYQSLKLYSGLAGDQTLQL